MLTSLRQMQKQKLCQQNSNSTETHYYQNNLSSDYSQSCNIKKCSREFIVIWFALITQQVIGCNPSRSDEALFRALISNPVVAGAILQVGRYFSVSIYLGSLMVIRPALLNRKSCRNSSRSLRNNWLLLVSNPGKPFRWTDRSHMTKIVVENWHKTINKQLI